MASFEPLHDDEIGRDSVQIANKILENDEVDEYVNEHSVTGQKYFAKSLIAVHWNIPRQRANDVKQILDSMIDLNDEDDEA